MKKVCPKCEGIPFRYKLVPDDSFVGAHYIQTVCRFCDGTGEVGAFYYWENGEVKHSEIPISATITINKVKK